MTRSINEPPNNQDADVQTKKLIRSSVDSVSRVVEDKAGVSSTVDTAQVSKNFRRLTNPSSPSKAMKKAGIALIAAPDPVTAVPGVALLASSVVLKKNEPTNLGNLALETRKVLRELSSLMT